MNLIINADDFGISKSVNQAITLLFSQGLCSSTTLGSVMPNFYHACQLARDLNFSSNIGIHLVFDGFAPITGKIKDMPLFCEKGLLKFSCQKHLKKYSTEEKIALANELRAQIKRVKEEGITPTHIDSHHHYHLCWGIVPVVAQVAKEAGIFRCRGLQNIWPSRKAFMQILKTAVINRRILLYGFKTPDHYIFLEDYLKLSDLSQLSKTVKTFEVAMHPDLDSKGNVVNLSFGNAVDGLELDLRKISAGNNLISFAKI